MTEAVCRHDSMHFIFKHPEKLVSLSTIFQDFKLYHLIHITLFSEYISSLHSFSSIKCLYTLPIYNLLKHAIVILTLYNLAKLQAMIALAKQASY